MSEFPAGVQLEGRDPGYGRPPVDATRVRAEALARAHHAEMGVAMRRITGKPVIVGPWSGLPVQTQLVLVAVMKALLERGEIA